MIKWCQYLSFLPLMNLSSSLGVTSYIQGAWSCSWTCFWIPGTSLIRITGKRGTGLEHLKINLSWSLQLQPWNRRELCEIWFRISWFLDLSLGRPMHLALRRRRGMGLSCCWLWVCVDFYRGGSWILWFLLSSNLSPGREAWSTWQQHSAWCRLKSLWSGTCCFGVCSGVVCLGFSSFGCLTCLAVKC